METRATGSVAVELKIPKITLVTTMQRLRDDRQLRYIWTLYNFIESPGGSGTGDGNARSGENPPQPAEG